MAISKLGMKMKRESVRDDLKKVKERAEEIVKEIERIENTDDEENYTEYDKGMILIRKAKEITESVAHMNIKAAIILPQVSELAFEMGRDFENQEAD